MAEPRTKTNDHDAVARTLAPGEVDVEAAGRRLAGFATTAFGPIDGRDASSTPSGGAPAGVSSENDPWLGRVLSNVYRVERKIGEGGMGAVYAARHVHLNKQYAVKVLSSAIAANTVAVERLRQEAIAASSIDHDNIVEVISFDGDEHGAVYIVMEFLRGESLADRVARGPMALHEALPIAHQIASALSAAHARGIVHRDLKPENVFLAKKGEHERAKVLDFGISKVKSADAEQVRMTRTGQMVGTPLYMSPEQARGETEIDQQVDVYALGVILFEMLTGAPPFDGRNYFELLWKHGNEAPPSLRAQRPDGSIPVAVEAVVLRALAKRRDERFPTMQALSDALDAAAPGIGVPASTSLTSLAPLPRTALEPGVRTEPSVPAVDPTQGSRRLAIGAVVATILVVAGLAWAVTQGSTTTPTGDAAPPTATAPTPAPTPEPAPTLGPSPTPTPAPAAPPVDLEAAPALVAIRVESTPPGAEVRLGDRVLCTTPCEPSLEEGRGATLVLHRDGYLDVSETVEVVRGGSVEVTLRPRRRSVASESGAGSTLPMKTEL